MNTWSRINNRSPDKAAWELRAEFSLDEVAALRQAGDWIDKCCGVVAGYPAALRVRNKAAGPPYHTLGASFVIQIPKINLKGIQPVSIPLSLAFTLTGGAKSRSRAACVRREP